MQQKMINMKVNSEVASFIVGNIMGIIYGARRVTGASGSACACMCIAGASVCPSVGAPVRATVRARHVGPQTGGFLNAPAVLPA